jgi:murein DD-endopeptidase MepM/ murein hydrolase activator NlpD
MQPCNDLGGYRGYSYRRSDNKIHTGHDYNCDLGEEVKAIADGEVLHADLAYGFGSDGAKGGVVIIQHKEKNIPFVTISGHLNFTVKKGQKVKAGEVIGKIHEYKVGNDNLEHLHFCVWLGKGIPNARWGYVDKMEDYINPKAFIKYVLEA